MKKDVFRSFIKPKNIFGNIFSTIILSLFLVFNCVHAGNLGTPWPMYRQNARHTGLSPYIGTSGYTQLFRLDFNGTCVTNSAIVNPDGSIFIASSEGKLYNISRHGDYNWIFDATASIASTPIFTPTGKVCFGTFDGIFYCLDAWSGRIEWLYYADWFPISTSTSMDEDGMLYFCTQSGKLICLYEEGQTKWITELNAEVDTSTPAIDENGNIYIGTLDETKMLAKVNRNGVIQWFISLPGGKGIVASPTIGPDKAIYIGTTAGMLCKVDSTGQLLWNTPLDGEVSGGVAVTPGDNIVVGTMGHMLYLVNPDDGEILWENQLNGAIQYGPIVDAAGIIYVGTLTSDVSSYYPNGTLKEKIVSGIFHGPLSLDNYGTLYGTIDWSVFAAGLPYPSLTLSSNRNRFSVGESLVLKINEINPRDTVFQGDIKVWMEGPDRKIIPIIHRYKLNIPENSNETITIYKYIFKSDDVPGNYSIKGRLLDWKTGELLASDLLPIYFF